jgi:predicted CoA-binding protein
MTPDHQDTGTVRKILDNSMVIAVVGLSDKKDRPSYEVAAHLQKLGYTIIPVNPTVTEVLGQKSYPDLESIPFDIDVVDIFRKSEEVLPIVQSAIRKKVKAIWLQEGIYNQEAAEVAEKAGIDIVMGLCMRKESEKDGS